MDNTGAVKTAGAGAAFMLPGLLAVLFAVKEFEVLSRSLA